MRKRLVRLLPWLVTAGLLLMLFMRTSVTEVIDAARASAGWTLPVGLLCVIGIYIGDSFAMWRTFGWFLAKMSFADVLLVRGATYLLAAINYNVGQGAIVYFVHRTAGTSIMRGAATVLLVMGTNVLALLFLSTAGLAVADGVPQAAKILLAVGWAGLLLYVALVAARPRWLDRPIFQVLLDSGIGGHLRALAVRIPHIASLVAFQYTMLHALHVQVPLVAALATLPIVFLVQVLPISVQGLGTTQAVMVFFFARYAPGNAKAAEAAVIAASLLGQGIALAFQATLGVACLRSRVGRALSESVASPATPATPAAPASSQPGASASTAGADVNPRQAGG
jgi:hypothetical protein